MPDLARPDLATDGLGLALAAQHAELAQMRAQMASLRQDLLAAARRGIGASSEAAAASSNEVGRLFAHDMSIVSDDVMRPESPTISVYAWYVLRSLPFKISLSHSRIWIPSSRIQI